MNTRDRIVHTAARLFQTKGYSATGLNEILAESKAPKGSLYYYFPEGKLQLAIEAVRYSGRLINDSVAARLSEAGEPEEAFRSILVDMIDRFATHDPHFEDVSLSIIALESSAETGELRKACQAALDEREGLFVEKLAACGYGKAEASRLGRLLQILIEGAITATQTRDDPSALHAVVDYLPILLAAPKTAQGGQLTASTSSSA